MASPRKRRLLKLARAKKAVDNTEAPEIFEDTGTIHTPEPPTVAVKVEVAPEPVVEEPQASPPPPKKTTKVRKSRKTTKKED